MYKHKFSLLILLSATLIIAGCSTMKKTSDTVLTNGHFYTIDKKNSWAEAVAIKSQRCPVRFLQRI